jgi:hypothetical protein
MLSRYRREFTLKGAPAAETEVAKSDRRGLPFDKLRMNKLTMREPGYWQIIRAVALSLTPASLMVSLSNHAQQPCKVENAIPLELRPPALVIVSSYG